MGICKNVDHRLSDTSIYGFKMIFVIAGVTDSTIVFVINYIVKLTQYYTILHLLLGFSCMHDRILEEFIWSTV